jgi:diguanylate cyclase (GGDEF)-like protein
MAEQQRHILCVEDDADDLFLLKECLSGFVGGSTPYELTSCTTLKNALETAKPDRTDLILLDLYLPDSQGFDSFSALHTAFPQIPIVILSSLDDERIASEAVRQGAQDYLVKGTIDPWRMGRIIQYALERHRILQELNQATAQLEKLALNDPLTALLNRRGLERSLTHDFSRWDRAGSVSAVILIDMDNFKKINDGHGHAAGDVVLKEVARRFTRLLRAHDLASRVGGDEFLIVLPDTRLAEARRLAERIRASLAQSPVKTPMGQDLSFTASLGVVSIPPGQPPSIDSLLELTHQTLYQSKREGRNRVSCETDPTGKLLINEKSFPDYFESLQRSGTFYAVRQPIVALLSMRPVGYEYYIRSRTPEIESPDVFFRLCQEHKILEKADSFCFDTCLHAKIDPDEKGMMRHINVFPTTLLSPEFQQQIDALVLENKGDLCIEVSDQQIVGDPTYLVEPVKNLKKKGCLFALDDIGFGRSYLESVILLEPDIIKIDQRCIKGIAHDPALVRMMQRMLQMTDALKIKVIVEGIENDEDLKTLQGLGVKYGQGYALGKPR